MGKVVAEGTTTVVEEMYLTPLREATGRLELLLSDEGVDTLEGGGNMRKRVD